MCWSWYSENSWGTHTPHFQLLPNAAKCLSIVVWRHSSCSTGRRVVNRESRLISCSKRSISTFDLCSSSSLYFLLRKRSNQYHAVQIDISLGPIVLHIWFVRSVMLWPKQNSWSKSARISVRKMFISARLCAFISIDKRSFEQSSHPLSMPLVSKLRELSTVRYDIFQKNART